MIQDVVTRWDSTYFMIKRFVLLEEAIKHTLALTDIDVPRSTTDESDIIRQLCDVLEHCADVTKEMSAENFVTASKIIPVTRVC